MRPFCSSGMDQCVLHNRIAPSEYAHTDVICSSHSYGFPALVPSCPFCLIFSHPLRHS